MTKPGITYQAVAAAADAICNAGQQPTIRALRERLGNGSPNTIHKHLAAWRENRPLSFTTATELPPALMSAIADELKQAASNATRDLMARLEQAQAEAAELSAAGEAAEADAVTRVSELTDRVSALTTERDILAGKATQYAATHAEQRKESERERAASQAARDALARIELQVDVQTDTVHAQATEIERLRTALDTARTARAGVEQQAAVLAAKLEAMTDRVTRADARIERIEAQLDKLTTSTLENLDI